MNQQFLDLYTDYLTVTFNKATATGLSALLDGEYSHDKITRYLNEREYTSRDLWKQVKPVVRQIERDDGVLIFDDTIQEKPHMDDNELVCWHFDHTKNRSVKGINLLNCIYHVGAASIPVAFELVKKPVHYCDLKTREEKRASEIGKNEQMRNMLNVCIENQLKFEWVLFDSWFRSTENMEHIKLRKKKDFIGALKSNRQVALSEEDWVNKRFTSIDQLELPEGVTVTAWLKGMAFPVRLVRQVFTNKDGSTGILYLVCSRLESMWNEITTTYKKRWQVEVYHKSLKSNAALAKSPARTVVAQSNHFFAAIITVFKMETIKMQNSLNHFALKAKLYARAVKIAFDELRAGRVVSFCA